MKRPPLWQYQQLAEPVSTEGETILVDKWEPELEVPVRIQPRVTPHDALTFVQVVVPVIPDIPQQQDPDPVRPLPRVAPHDALTFVEDFVAPAAPDIVGAVYPDKLNRVVNRAPYALDQEKSRIYWPQFARPDQDVSEQGTWANVGFPAGDRYPGIDENWPPDFSDYIEATGVIVGDYYEAGLSNVAYPKRGGRGHIFRTQVWNSTGSSSKVINVTVSLKVGDTVIATDTASLSWLAPVRSNTREILTTGEIDAISDYSQLRIRVEVTSLSGGGPNPDLAISFMELETPPPQPVPDMDNWYKELERPTLPPPRIIEHPAYFFTQVQFAEAVNLDKWYQPLARPVLPRPPIIPPSWFFTELAIPEVVTMDKWYRPLSEPVRLEPIRPRPAEFRTLRDLVAVPGLDSWYRPLAMPVLPARRPININRVTHVNIAFPDAPPIADAGPDQTVNDVDGSGAENVTLDGSGSFDDFGITDYDWTEGGSPIASGVNPTVSLAVGTHVIQLEVTDTNSQTDTDTVTIIVTPQELGDTYIPIGDPLRRFPERRPQGGPHLLDWLGGKSGKRRL